MGRTLELVTGDITKPNQATTVLAELTADGTGAWSSNDWIPFNAPGSQDLAVLALGGTQTLRLRISSGDGDNDAILLYKAGVTAVPVVGISGSVITYTGTLESSDTLGGTYSPVAGATSPYTVPPGTEKRYYRSRN